MRWIAFDIETIEIVPGEGFDPSNQKITVVCIYDSETREYKGFFENDLPSLWPILEHADALVGYNSDHFDIPILNRYYPGDLTKIRSIDLLKEIKNSLGRRLRLDGVAKATLGTGKTANGYMAGVWWKNGEYEKVKEYCMHDVEVTKGVFEYALEKGSVKYSDLGEVREIKLDTKNWLKPQEKPAMTHTLPF